MVVNQQVSSSRHVSLQTLSPCRSSPRPSFAGWSSTGDIESPPSYPSSPRESHFSRASRASRRSQLSYRGTGNGGEDGLGAVDELGMLEKGGRRREVETPEAESFVESGSGSIREEEAMMMREVRTESREEQRSSEKSSILRGAA